MSGILNKMKGLFVTETGGTTSKSKSTKDEAKPEEEVEQVSPQSRPSEVTLEIADVEGQVDDKFLEILLNAMNEANTPGFDYLEYKRSLVSLREMNMDEPTRYKAAYATAEAMGANPAALQNSAKYYLDILGKEDAKFLDALKAQSVKRLSGAQEAIQDLESGIQDKISQIERLSQEIEEAKSELSLKKQELEASQEKLGRTKANFEASYSNLRDQIASDLQNISKYLAG